MKLFIYGSIKKGFFNHKRFGFDKLPFLGEHKVKGYCLINLGAYPGMVPSPQDEDEVKGELYEIDDGSKDYAFLYKVEANAGYTTTAVDYVKEDKQKVPIVAFIYRGSIEDGPKVEGGNWLET